MALKSKVCSKCKENKSLSLFNNSHKSPDGKRSECKSCQGGCGKIFRESKLPLPKKIESLDGEVWIEFELHGRLYAVSNYIRIKGLSGEWRRDEYFLRQWTRKNSGYTTIKLGMDGGEKNHTVHRIVAKAFVPNPEIKPCVNHKNGIKSDNRIENLEWCTYPENTNHAYLNGLINPSSGTDHCFSKLIIEEVIDIFNSTLTHKELSIIYGVSQTAIRHIKCGKTYKKITNATYKKKKDKKYEEMVIAVFKSSKRKCELVKSYPFSLTTIKNIKNGKSHYNLTKNITR